MLVYCVHVYCVHVYCVHVYCVHVYCVPVYCVHVYCVHVYCVHVYCVHVYCLHVYCFWYTAHFVCMDQQMTSIRQGDDGSGFREMHDAASCLLSWLIMMEQFSISPQITAKLTFINQHEFSVVNNDPQVPPPPPPLPSPPPLTHTQLM